MWKNCCLALIVFTFVSCIMWRPYYIVNESDTSVRLEMLLKKLADTSRLHLDYISGTDRSIEFNRVQVQKLRFQVKNRRVVYVDIPSKVIVLLKNTSTPVPEEDIYYPIRNHTFIQQGITTSYDEKSFHNKLVGKHWYSISGKNFFVYK